MFFNIIASLIVAVAAFVPTYIYLGARFWLSPEGFWREFILLGAGMWLLGILQFVLILVGSVLLILIWLHNIDDF